MESKKQEKKVEFIKQGRKVFAGTGMRVRQQGEADKGCRLSVIIGIVPEDLKFGDCS